MGWWSQLWSQEAGEESSHKAAHLKSFPQTRLHPARAPWFMSRKESVDDKKGSDREKMGQSCQGTKWLKVGESQFSRGAGRQPHTFVSALETKAACGVLGDIIFTRVPLSCSQAVPHTHQGPEIRQTEVHGPPMAPRDRRPGFSNGTQGPVGTRGRPATTLHLCCSVCAGRMTVACASVPRELQEVCRVFSCASGRGKAHRLVATAGTRAGEMPGGEVS